MRRVIFSRLAKQELEDAMHYYELEHSGLGGDFRDEIEKAIQRIVEHPESWSIERGDVRKGLLHKFPYKHSCTQSKQTTFLYSRLLTNIENQIIGSMKRARHNKSLQQTPTRLAWYAQVSSDVMFNKIPSYGWEWIEYKARH